MVIYVDVLFFTNFMMDLFLLAATALIAGRPAKPLRLVPAGCAGALAACFLFFWRPHWGWLIPIRFLLPLPLLLIAFPFERLRSFLRTVLIFWSVGLLCGGGLYAFYAYTDAGSKMRYSGGVYYMDLPLWLILAAAFGFYGIARLFFWEINRRKEKTFTHTVTLDGCSVLALLDTGNSLYDPISLLPVILCDWDAFSLPEPLLRAILHEDTAALPRLSAAYPELRLRLLPYTDATGARVLLYAFRPKRLLIDGVEREALIGLVRHPLAPDGRFRALLHRDWSNL